MSNLRYGPPEDAPASSPEPPSPPRGDGPVRTATFLYAVMSVMGVVLVLGWHSLTNSMGGIVATAFTLGAFAAITFVVGRLRYRTTSGWGWSSVLLAVLLMIPATPLWILAFAALNSTCGPDEFLCFAGPGFAAVVATPAAVFTLLAGTQMYGVASATDRARRVASVGFGMVAGLVAAGGVLLVLMGATL